MMIRSVFSKAISTIKDASCRTTVLIILFGFVIRLFSFHSIHIVNPDGVLYIHQARAIYYGIRESIFGCSLSFLSNYPILISAAYTIFHDWILAARSISILFGTLTLIPLFLLLRRFFEPKISQLAILLFSLIPFLVDRSVDVVRDPVYWFFSCLGLYLFVRQIERKSYLYLALSNISFLMATWARIEAILFIGASFVFIPFIKGKGRIKELSVFVMPLALLLLAGMVGLMITEMPVKQLFRTDEVIPKIEAPLIEYTELRKNLANLSSQPLEGTIPAFLHKARNLVWLIAAGTVIVYIIRAFFYPFFLIFLVGFGGLWTRIKGDIRLRYLSLLSILALTLLLIHAVHTWTMFNRFCAVFILPSFVVIGFGLRRILDCVKAWTNVSEVAIISLLCALILASGLPKNLQQREADKTAFKEIGELLAQRKGNNQAISIGAVSVVVSGWVSFYANLAIQGAPCPHENDSLAANIGTSYAEFVKHLRSQGIRYFLWEEKRWPEETFDFIKAHSKRDFRKIGTWKHPDTGTMVLFELIRPKKAVDLSFAPQRAEEADGIGGRPLGYIDSLDRRSLASAQC
jgi:4-amino-4-deoxy-L-arabinose transferase-like glycosyltransferase